MSKLYQPIKNNPYRLRDGIYWRVVYDIRDVGKLQDGYYDFDPDFKRRYAPSQDTVDKVMTALQEEPEEYREMIFASVVYNQAFPEGYRGKKTTLQKAHFIYRCAELLGYELGPREIVHVTYDWR